MVLTFIRKDFISAEKVPTLAKLSHVQVLMLVTQAAKIGQVLEFRQRLLELPKNLIEELFEAAFFNSHSNVINTSIYKLDRALEKRKLYPASLLSKLREFQGEDLFNLWWIFFDENHTKKIGVEINCPTFSTMLMKYLKNIKSVLQELVISYNWILRQEFKYLLDHLITLKHLTVFSSYGAENKVLEDVSQSKCNLESFKFGNDKFHELDQGVLVKFIKSQANSITDLDLIKWSYSSLVIQELIKCKHLQRLKGPFLQMSLLSSSRISLSKTSIDDITISFAALPRVNYDENIFGWLQDLPSRIKIRIIDCNLIFNENDYSPQDVFQNVVEVENIKLYSSLCWIMESTWKNLEKMSLSVVSLSPSFSYNSTDTKWQMTFPSLKEVNLNIGCQGFYYSSFQSLLFGSPKLENLAINFAKDFTILRFDKQDFEQKLEKSVNRFKLKNLSLRSATRQEVIPFQSLLRLIDKCPFLDYINCDAKNHPEVVIPGFMKVYH